MTSRADIAAGRGTGATFKPSPSVTITLDAPRNKKTGSTSSSDTVGCSSRYSVCSMWAACSSLSVASIMSCFAMLSMMSIFSFMSVLSSTSALSALSVNSVLSVLSVNSVLSIGCTNSMMQICFGNETNATAI